MITAGPVLAAALLYATPWKLAIGQALPGALPTLNCGTAPCDAVARGRIAFSDRNPDGLGGNGRACADCHVPADHFQLSPALARGRFDALRFARLYNKNADDPLMYLSS